MINMARCEKHGMVAHHTLSICKRCTAENGGTLPAIAQQLKPKMPSYEDVYQGFCAAHGGIGISETIGEVLEAFYKYIARHFGH